MLSTVAGIGTKAKDIKGFITTDLFVNLQAYLIALKLPQGLPDILISEDLYSDLY
jgi:hypothetical protein